MSIGVRPAKHSDVPALCALLNEIIRIGGTTAHQTEMTEEDFAAHFLGGSGFLCCFVAEKSGVLLGFQAVERHGDALPEGWADIGTFARAAPKVPGVGTALFRATRTRASELGIVAINATIRADNRSGLAYYDKMGFEDYSTQNAVPLMDGTPVDRISKRYLVA